MFVKQNQKYVFNTLSTINTYGYSKEVRPIVDTIKKIIKNKKNDSTNKVYALRLLNQCLMEGGGKNEEFLLYTEKKIMRRLTILARYKKVGIQSIIAYIGIKRIRQGRAIVRKDIQQSSIK
jgi:hypothetical protein